MKKIIVLLLLTTLPNIVLAQDINRTGISVSGTSHYQLEDVAFKAVVRLSTKEAGYLNFTYGSIKEMKEDFFKKLSDKGIESSKFKELPLDYLGLGRNSNGVFYEFITSNEVELKTFIDNAIPGSYINSLMYKKKLVNNTVEQITAEALEDAKNKATALANQLGKKVGEVIYIKPSYPIIEEGKWDYYSYERDYKIDVTYKLLD